ncbi:DUF6382 domain-containing protein [Herbivorax sp. ANBcel31]|uniref:DUF6382 domain-containing protein n=1 Tax=Herbivorax sp. ANBcel31 TaxID=3069754 RepID=UPI0027B0766B|nr:DUF6382 domain-containing protein [Herbivorax sp. ANBcel31]MDQ2085703.1 DUF6382 domain-containing protein [Herbivorax sp. ANBcel31]
MNNFYSEKLEFDYESSASGNFLVISIDASEKIHEYQVGILANNPNKNILPLDVRQKDDKHNLYYNITSKLSLAQYLKRNKIDKNTFVSIFSGITKTILSSKDYLFSEKSFLLMDEYMYINPNNLEIALVYLPFNVNTQLNINDVLKEFTKNFIINSADMDESNNDNFIQKVINLLKLDTFTVLEFEKLLKELKVQQPYNKNTINKPAPTASEQFKNKSNNTPKPQSDCFEKNKPDIPPSKNNFNIPKPPKKTQKPKSSVEKSRNTETKMKYNSNVIVLGFVLQLIIVTGSVILLTSDALDSLGNDMGTNIVGIVILAGAISLLLWKNILNKKNIIETVSSKEPAHPKPSNSNISKPQVNTNKKEILSFSQNKHHQEQNIQPNVFNTNSKASDETTLLSQEGQDETTLLNSQDPSPPYLQANKDGVLEEIKITKPEFIIGRLKDQVDYVTQNKAIGKVHAEIITKNGQYFLKDLNSKNGTFINDKRLNSNVEYEIKDNDIIVFANSKYIFKIP